MYLFEISWSVCVVYLAAAQSYTDQKCYGVIENQLSPQCNTGEVLYVYDVYTYAKQSSTLNEGCANIRQTDDYNETYCCNYVNDTVDCGMKYYGSGYPHYCVGVSSCTAQVAWNTTASTCDQSVFLPNTNYMKMSYYCKNESEILSICSSSSLSGNPVYIWSQNYPGKISDCSGSSGCSCTVSSSDGSTIKINLLDLRLHDYSNSDCHQQLHITDGSSEHVISCTDFNAFEKRTAYTSTTESLTIRFDNVFSYSIGNFWIELEGSNTAAVLSMSCGSATAVYGCGASLTATTTTETTTGTSTATTTGTTMTSPTNSDTTTPSTSTDTTTPSTSTDTTTPSTSTDTTTPSTSTDTTTPSTSTDTTTPSTSTDTTTPSTSTAKTTTVTGKDTAAASTDSSSLQLVGIIVGSVVGAVVLWRVVLQVLLMSVMKYCRRGNAKKSIKPESKSFDSDKKNKVKSRTIQVSESSNASRKPKTKFSSRYGPQLRGIHAVDPPPNVSHGENVQCHDSTGKSFDAEVVRQVGNNVKIKYSNTSRQAWINLARIKKIEAGALTNVG